MRLGLSGLGSGPLMPQIAKAQMVYVRARLAKLELGRAENGLTPKEQADFDALTDWEARLIYMERPRPLT